MAFHRRQAAAFVADLAGETMGTRWSAKIVGGTPDLAAQIQAALDRVVAEVSQWQPASDLSRFNRSESGRWQPLPRGFETVLAAGLRVAEVSAGAFDPAMGALADLWGFGPSGPQPVPDDDAIAAALAVSGLSHIEQDGRRARRLAPARLDFSGIAKGYGVDAVAERLRGAGFADFLIEVGGELRGEGIKPDGQPWWVDLEAVPGLHLPGIRVALHGLAIATSGDYRRNVEHRGKRLGHTLDPRTGMPLENDVASVTVLHAECMLADAWATALTVLGPEAGPAAAEREGLAMHMVVRESDDAREILSPAFAAMLS